MSQPKLFYLLHKAHRAVFREAERQLRDRLGISSVQQGALLFIGAHEGCSMSDVANGLDLNNSAVTGLAARMEKAGLIDRRADPKDGRAGRVYLSAKGWTVRAAALPYVQDQNARLAAPFDADELETITRFLTHLISLGETPAADAHATSQQQNQPEGLSP